MESGLKIQTVADISRRQHAVRAEKTALQYGETATTYQQLDIRTNQIANGLIALGSSSQQRIAYLNKNADSFYELLLGCTKCNTVFVPLNYRLANPEITFIINDSQAETLFVSADYFHQIEAIRGELTRVKTIIALEGDHPRWERFESWRERQSIVDPHSPNHSEDVALQLYTSGTTGRPKGVELTHANLLSALQSGVVRWGFRSDDISLACIPFYHVAGMAWGLAGLYVGAKSRLVRQIEPSELLTIIEQEHVTRTLLVPAVILFLTQTAEIETTDLSSLERIAYGASPIPLELLKVAMRLIKCSFSQAYGLTETTGGITSLPASDHVNPSSNRLNSCGQPLPGVEIRVVDPHGDDLPFGEVGEIICRSDQNMKGYWKRPQATARALRDGWLFTGDAGYLDGDGYLYIHDRINDMIVSGAENVYPAEVESALFEHPAVADVAVIGVPDAKWGETVKAIVVCHAGEAVSAEALIAFARERIAGYKVPRSVDFVEHLPRNPSGKLLKRELRKPYWAGHSRRVN